MAERLLEAWDDVRAGRTRHALRHHAAKGKPSTGAARHETLIPDDPDERQTYALRIVAQRCLYGVDKNPLAVEMAKLSLWLLTLAKDKPFEFLDHAIRCGDSLVGIHNIDQLRHFNLKPRSRTTTVLFRGPLDEAVDEAIGLRLKLEDDAANTVEDVERQEKLLKEAEREDRPAAVCGGPARGRRVLGRERQGQGGTGPPRPPSCRATTSRRDRPRSSSKRRQGTPRPDDVPLATGVSRGDRQARRVRCLRWEPTISGWLTLSRRGGRRLRNLFGSVANKTHKKD